MKRILAITMTLALTACSTTGGQRIVPAQSTIARIESGKQLVRDLGTVGAYGDPSVMNAESRVRVRGVACVPRGADTAECTYEASRCEEAEADSDEDGWCERTSKFVRTKFLRAPFDVIVRGWALERPDAPATAHASIPIDLRADPPVAQIIRQNIPICLESSPDCEARQTETANDRSNQGLSLIIVATDESGAYALFQRDLGSRSTANPRVWIFRDPREKSATSLLWDIDCQAQTYTPVAEMVQDEHGSVTSYRPGAGTPLHAKARTALAAVVETICKAPVMQGYTHL